MNEEIESPLLARMTTINKPSFWIYAVICMALFIYQFTITPKHTYPALQQQHSTAIIGISVFVALFLELLSQFYKHKPIAHTLRIIIYVFEVISILYFAFVLFFK